MSVTFSTPNYDGALVLNVANVNARELLAHLGIDGRDLVGDHDATDLVRRCHGRLTTCVLLPDGTPVFAPAHDRALPASRNGRTVVGGRAAGYLRDKTEALLRLACFAESRGERRLQQSTAALLTGSGACIYSWT